MTVFLHDTNFYVFQTLQNFMYTMLKDNNPVAAKMSLVRTVPKFYADFQMTLKSIQYSVPC